MSAAIALTPTSGNITAKKTIVRVDITGGSSNTVTGYDANAYPQEPEVRYHLEFSATGQDTLKSYEFAVGSDGKHTFNNFVFPAAATWTVTLKDHSGSTIQTASAIVA